MYSYYGGGQMPNGSIYGSILDNNYSISYFNNQTKITKLKYHYKKRKLLFFQLENTIYYISNRGIIELNKQKLCAKKIIFGHTIVHHKNWNKTTILDSDNGLIHP